MHVCSRDGGVEYVHPRVITRSNFKTIHISRTLAVCTSVAAATAGFFFFALILIQRYGQRIHINRVEPNVLDGVGEIFK